MEPLIHLILASQIYSVTADSETPVGHSASFSMNISAFPSISSNGTFDEIIGQIPVLILDLDPNANSGASNVEYASKYGHYSPIFDCIS